MRIQTAVFGYPRIGDSRELKKTVEGYWGGEIDRALFLERTDELMRARMKKFVKAGIDSVPSNDFSLYDFILDTATMFGVIPERFAGISGGLERYFAMARGSDDAPACEMTKWFDTNYHYIVPEFSRGFSLAENRPLASYRWAKEALGLETRPVMTGPFTFVASGKIVEAGGAIRRAVDSPAFRDLLLDIAPLYNRALLDLEAAGAAMVQLDEPALVMDRSAEDIDLLVRAYEVLGRGLSHLEVVVHTYYEGLSCYERVVRELPVGVVGLDFTCNDENLVNVRTHGFPKDKKLMAGLLSGRDPWALDFKWAVALTEELSGAVGGADIMLSNAAPLSHLPVSVRHERGHLDDDLADSLSFADERLAELSLLKRVIEGGEPVPRRDAPLGGRVDEAVRKRVAAINEKKIGRPHPFRERYAAQREKLGLPDFPTTTIGSFPQTGDVRKKRADFNAGRVPREEYEDYLKGQSAEIIRLQEELGLDVLVHGELERTDMVEFFGQRMKGFAFTLNGWVQSYGTRCVRPPIIYGDISRPEPMTVRETSYARSLTPKPVKGILTGPATILNWSFYRRDIPRKQIAFQLAMALRDEVRDLEAAGIGVIQIDEPAFREGLPLKKSKQGEYLGWAINAFKLTNEQVREETQIHAHMCYAEFNEIIEAILALDTDVISIEASRSGGEILQSFEDFSYNHGIGLGVYDVHSPRVPTVDEMIGIVRRSARLIDPGLLWINPDCGLKTRGYAETLPALKNMVAAARTLRSAGAGG